MSYEGNHRRGPKQKDRWPMATGWYIHGIIAGYDMPQPGPLERAAFPGERPPLVSAELIEEGLRMAEVFSAADTLLREHPDESIPIQAVELYLQHIEGGGQPIDYWDQRIGLMRQAGELVLNA